MDGASDSGASTDAGVGGAALGVAKFKVHAGLPAKDVLERLAAVQPERFAPGRDAKLAAELLSGLKALFDALRKADSAGVGSGLDELVTEGFDKEQLWAMLEMENEPVIKHVENRSRALVRLANIRIVERFADQGSDNDDDDDEDEDSDGSASEAVDSEADSEDEEEEEYKSASAQIGDDGSEMSASVDSEEEDEAKSKQQSAGLNKKRARRSEQDGSDSSDQGEDGDDDTRAPTEMDDEFFKFSDMERFVESVEQDDIDMKLMLEERKRLEKQEAARKAERKMGAAGRAQAAQEAEADDYSDDGNAEDDMAEEDDEVSDEYDESDDGGEGADYKFADLWGGKSKGKSKRKAKSDASADGLESEIDEEKEESEADDSEADAGSGMQDEDNAGQEAELSTFERQQAEIRAQIAELENEAMAQKPWELKGEVEAFSRPQNSLLEKGDLDVDFLSRPAPTITEESTKSLEDKIKQRILDGDFDDVERKLPLALDANFKPRAELSVEKSKVGLAEEYAKEYEEQVMGHTPEEDAKRTAEQQEIQGMFTELFHKLDALSNFHYTPKPATLEGAIKPLNVGAIQMEEALPITESGARQAAPQEVRAAKKGRDGLGKSTEELDQSERKQLRQTKKAARRSRKRLRDSEKRIVSQLNPGLGNKHAKKAVLDRAEAGDNVNWTKSSDFFKRLQTAEDGTRAARPGPGAAAAAAPRSAAALRL